MAELHFGPRFRQANQTNVKKQLVWLEKHEIQQSLRVRREALCAVYDTQKTHKGVGLLAGKKV